MTYKVEGPNVDQRMLHNTFGDVSVHGMGIGGTPAGTQSKRSQTMGFIDGGRF